MLENESVTESDESVVDNATEQNESTDTGESTSSDQPRDYGAELEKIEAPVSTPSKIVSDAQRESDRITQAVNHWKNLPTDEARNASAENFKKKYGEEAFEKAVNAWNKFVDPTLEEPWDKKEAEKVEKIDESKVVKQVADQIRATTLLETTLENTGISRKDFDKKHGDRFIKDVLAYVKAGDTRYEATKQALANAGIRPGKPDRSLPTASGEKGSTVKPSPIGNLLGLSPEDYKNAEKWRKQFGR